MAPLSGLMKRKLLFEQVEEEEAPPVMEEAQPNILKEQSPSNIVNGVLGELAPQERWPNLIQAVEESLTMSRLLYLKEIRGRENNR